jgi:hypothetical protein
MGQVSVVFIQPQDRRPVTPNDAHGPGQLSEEAGLGRIMGMEGDSSPLTRRPPSSDLIQVYDRSFGHRFRA